MKATVDALVYQLEDDDAGVRWKTLQKLRRIAAVEYSHFPVQNTRRFLECVRRRIVGEPDIRVAIEALRLLGDVMFSLADNVDPIISSILPDLIPILGIEDGSKILHEEVFLVFQKYTNATNDLQGVADLLVSIGLRNGHGCIREISLLVLMRLLDDHFQKPMVATRAKSTTNAIRRGDKMFIVALAQAIIPALQDANEKVVIAGEKVIAKLELYWGNEFSSDITNFLSNADKQSLHAHRSTIEKRLHDLASPSCGYARENFSGNSSSITQHQPSEVFDLLDAPTKLCFGFVNLDDVNTLTSSLTNSSSDYKRRSTAVENIYIACKQADGGVLRGLAAVERDAQKGELMGLFDILIRLTQDVDVHIVKRALQITQILFRKLSPPVKLFNGEKRDVNIRNDGLHINAALYMTSMLNPLVKTVANFAGDDEMESFVFTLLEQMFESGCMLVNVVERTLAVKPLRHRRSQVREKALKVWILLLVVSRRQSLFAAQYAPDEVGVQVLGRLLGDASAKVRDLALELAAVLETTCRCNVYALLDASIEDEFVSERVDWVALHSKLRRSDHRTKRLESAATEDNINVSLRGTRYPASVEQSLNSVSELKMLVANDKCKPHDSAMDDSYSATNDSIMTAKSPKDLSFLGHEPQKTSSNEGIQNGNISDKLSALKTKVERLRQSRAKRVQCPNSQDNVKTERGAENSYEQLLPRSKRSSQQSTCNNLDNVDNLIYGKLGHPRNARVHPNSATAFPATELPPSQQLTQQHSQIMSDRKCKNERQTDDQAPSITYSSPDERPIRQLVASEDPNLIYLHSPDQGNTDDDNGGKMSSTKKQNREPAMSLATRKRLQAKAKCAESSNLNASSVPHRINVCEGDMQKPCKEPSRNKHALIESDVDSKSRKQEPRYLEPHEMTPLMSPLQDLSNVLTHLRSNNWEEIFEALSTIRRLAVHHAGIIEPSKMYAILAEILKHVESLRSSVSKNALLSLESICIAFSRVIESDVENIIRALLKRCTDSSTFVCESVSATLQTVVLRCTPSRVVAALASHVKCKAVPVRREVARQLYAVIAAQAEAIQASKDLPVILPLVGCCLEDSSNEVRDVAKQCIMYLHYQQRMSTERIIRFMPVSAQTKVNVALSGKVAYVPLLPAPADLLLPTKTAMRSTEKKYGN